MTNADVNAALPRNWSVGRIGAAVLSVPPAYIGILALLAVSAFLRPALLSPTLLLLILRQAAPLGLATVGQSLTMRGLSLDLSSGGVVVATSYILTSGYARIGELPLLALCLVFGLAIGALNGVLVVRLRASAVIVTLAVSMILTGVVIALSQYRAPGDAPDLLIAIGSSRIGIVPVAPVVWIVVLIPAAFLLRWTVFGRYLDAVGANPRAAALSGIPLTTIVFIAHVASSLTAVLAGFLLVGFVGVGSLTTGQDLPLNSLAATILGGVNFGNGRGGMLGPAVAAFMLTFLLNFLTSFGLGEPGKLMLQGAIIAVAALVYSMRQR
jgi:ribose transport system permease protein